MGRDYKFRGMDLQGRWFYGNLAVLEKDLRSTGNKAGHYISNSAGAPFAYAVRPETVGQYTGLKDKNGTEIYEGDVLHDGEGPGEVEWVQEHCAFMVFYRTESGNVYGNLESDGQLKNTVVRGNIHQHPELLKEGDG